MSIKKIIVASLLLLSFGMSAFAANIGVVNTGVLNFRSGPSTGNGIIGQLTKGTTVQVVSTVNSEWSKIEYKGKTGYVATRYLNIRENKPVVDRSSVERPAVLEGTIEASGYVNTSMLNFRTQPSTDAEIIAALPQYTQFWVICGVGNGWYKIYCNDREGYVSGSYVTMGQAPHAVNSAGANIVEYAKQFLGKPYLYGGNGPNSFDCSGFVKYIFANFGINLTRTSYSQVNEGYYVSKENLQAGDLVFFKSGGSVNHVGIYIADGMMIHASSPGDYVKYDSIYSGYYYNHYYTARRVL